MTSSTQMPNHVANVYASYPDDAREKLMTIRELIFNAAREQNVGLLTETLKWGEPAYLTEATKSGSTIRLAWKKTRPDDVSVFFNCKTTLVNDFREMFRDDFEFEGQRGLHIGISAKLKSKSLSCCLMRALTYHLSSNTGV